MTPERWGRLKDIFELVLATAEEDRAKVLREACVGDTDAESEIARMVEAHNTADPFIDNPPGRLLRGGLTPGDVLDGRFEVRELLGEGGMGQVWRAYDRRMREEIAIKVIRPEMAADPGVHNRFQREIQLARRIGHPNVCRVWELRDDAATGVTFFTMQLLEGETLASRLRRGGPIDPGQALPLIVQMASGLAAAHELGIVHRDFKPGNVMLVQSSTGLRAVITDFGLARDWAPAQSSASTNTQGVLGTPDYMAPEQMAGDPVTPAADIYGLGLVIHETLTGRHPFPSGNAYQGLLRRARETPPSLRTAVSGIDPAWDQAVRRCLEYDPANRFSSATDFLAAVTGGQSLRPTRPIRLGRRTAITAVAALILIVATLLSVRYLTDARPPADAVRWYSDAQQAMAEGAWFRALGELQKAVEIAPTFATAHGALGEVWLELDMPYRARDAMLRASDLVSGGVRLSDSDKLYIDGTRRIMLRECPQGVESLRAFAAGSPDDPLAALALARGLQRCEQYKDAVSVLDRAGKLDPRNAAVPMQRAAVEARRRRYPEAAAFLKQAEALYRTRANYEGLAEVLQTRGTLEAEQDKLNDAQTSLDQALELARATSNVQQQIRAMLQRGAVERRRGNMEAARTWTDPAVALAREHDLESLTIQSYFAAGNLHLVRNQFAEAKGQFDRALELAKRYRHEAHEARAALSLASVYSRTGEPDRAAENIKNAVPYYEKTGHVRNVALARTLLGQVRLMRAEYPQAAKEFEAEMHRARQAGDSAQELIHRENFATALAAMGRLPEAAQHYSAAAEAHRRSGKKSFEFYSVVNLAEILARSGKFAESAQALSQGEKLAAQLERRPAELQSRLEFVRAEIALWQGRHSAAAAGARRLLTAQPPAPVDRQLKARTILCAAETRQGRAAAGLENCGEVLTRARSVGLKSALLLALLHAAEAHLQTGQIDLAERAAAEACDGLRQAEAIEELWRAVALRARAAHLQRASDAQDLATAATRDLESLRNRWGEGFWAGYLERPDLRKFRSFHVEGFR